jgi:hypothetical protein
VGLQARQEASRGRLRAASPVTRTADASWPGGQSRPASQTDTGQAGMEPAADRRRAGRPRQHDPRAQERAAVEPARRLGDIEPSRASRAGQRRWLPSPPRTSAPPAARPRRTHRCCAATCWPNGKPAYRCRHGRTSAMTPDPSWPRNTYIRDGTSLIAVCGGGCGRRCGSAINRPHCPVNDLAQAVFGGRCSCRLAPGSHRDQVGRLKGAAMGSPRWLVPG